MSAEEPDDVRWDRFRVRAWAADLQKTLARCEADLFTLCEQVRVNIQKMRKNERNKEYCEVLCKFKQNVEEYRKLDQEGVIVKLPNDFLEPFFDEQHDLRRTLFCMDKVIKELDPQYMDVSPKPPYRCKCPPPLDIMVERKDFFKDVGLPIESNR